MEQGNKIRVVLYNEYDGYEEFTEFVDSSDDIVSYSIDYDLISDETVLCAFDTKQEIMRLNCNCDKEECDDCLGEVYTMYIFYKDDDYQDYLNKEGEYSEIPL